MTQLFLILKKREYLFFITNKVHFSYGPTEFSTTTKNVSGLSLALKMPLLPCGLLRLSEGTSPLF